MPWYLRYPNQFFAAAVAALQKTPTQGAWCSAYLASVAWPNIQNENGNSHGSEAQPFVLPTGKYWVNQKIQELWPCAQDAQGAKQLWIDSERYVGWNDKQ